MKARVKATGEILDVKMVMRYSDSYEPQRFYQCIKDGVPYKEELLDFDLVENYEGGGKILFDPIEPNYWEKLKHQAAISAMQAMLGNPDITASVDANAILSEYVVGNAVYYATALVEKLKNDSK